MSSIKKLLLASIGLILSISTIMASLYIPTPQDTSLPPETITYDDLQPDEFELLHETSNLAYYYREDRDIIAIKDKRNGYLWKTGLDIEFNRYLEEACNLVPDDEKVNCDPLEDRLNTTYTGIANSLLTIEYYDVSSSIRRLSSASDSGVTSKLATVNDDPAHRRLDIDFTNLNIQIKLHIHFDDEGIRYDIRHDEVGGGGIDSLAAIMLTPFLGASGGAKAFWDPEQQSYRRIVPNPKLDGYVLVPDGPGALIRFEDRNTNLTSYVGNVYGEDLTEADYYYGWESSYLPVKSPMMPVFGIAHGNRQAAFVSYALQGGEYMNIIVSPEENLTNYTFAYPRFEINKLFHQVYNKQGDGYFTLMENRNSFDISMRYDFLANDGSEDGFPADYVGMALKYRQHLLENDQLPSTISHEEIPIRLDFVMSDIKRSVFGVEDVIVTTANQVGSILDDVKALGINNVSSGLLGWQKGGITNGHPGRVSLKGAIGSRNDYRSLIQKAKDLGFDLSPVQDYVTINREQVNYFNTAAKHMNGWYLEYRLRDVMPISNFGYARPSVSAKWLLEQSGRLTSLGFDSLTVEGMMSILISETSNNNSEVHKTIDRFQSTFDKMDDSMQIAATTPNDYLWKYVNRFLQAPVYSSQFLIQTDTVPFLQMVINNSMDMFAPYSNFSFYTQSDVLRMIDYNLSPSFVLTHEPSYQLSLTNSARFYSTEYKEYKDLIQDIYGQVNSVLSEVVNARWIDRQVVENGVIKNVYDNGKMVMINYTNQDIIFNGTVIAPLSAIVMEVE